MGPGGFHVVKPGEGRPVFRRPVFGIRRAPAVIFAGADLVGLVAAAVAMAVVVVFTLQLPPQRVELLSQFPAAEDIGSPPAVLSLAPADHGLAVLYPAIIDAQELIDIARPVSQIG